MLKPNSIARRWPVRHHVPVETSNLAGKLEIRRRLLSAFPKGRPITVLDCCAGERGEIWKRLRREFPGKIKYMGLDRKTVGRGVVPFDSARWLREVAWSADVVDIDTYGEPWELYRAAVDRGLERLVVFLTYGFNSRGCLGPMSKTLCELSGIPGCWVKRLVKNTPGGICDWSQSPRNFRDMLVRGALAYPLGRGYRIKRCLQICCGPNLSTFYWGLRLERSGAWK